MLVPGTLLENRYLIEAQIGGGGTSTVYKAKDQRLNNLQVAVKETSECNDPVLRAAFEREARVLSHLDLKGLPRVTDHFEVAGFLYLIMDYIPGDDLGKQLQNNGQAFALNQVLQWGNQVLDILEVLHSYTPPIIHHDIKPQNLKLRQGNKIVLIDFGCAKGALAQKFRTTGVSIYGFSGAYAPPEQVEGEPTDERSDLYSLGVTLYQLMTNILPPSSGVRMRKLCGGNPDPLLLASDHNPSIPVFVADALHKAMAIEADHRFASASEMRAALNGAVAAQQQNPAHTQTTIVRGQPRQQGQQASRIVIPVGQQSSPTGQGTHQTLAAGRIGTFKSTPDILGVCDDAITCLAISPDGKSVAAGDAHGAVKVWDVNTRHLILNRWCAQQRRERVRKIIYSPDGKYLAAVDGNDFVRVWDVQAWCTYGNQPHLLPPDYEASISLQDPSHNTVDIIFAPYNSSTLLLALDGALHKWEFTTGQISSRQVTPDHNHPNVKISPNCRYIMYFSPVGRDMEVINVTTLHKQNLSGPARPPCLNWVTGVDVSPDERFLACGFRYFETSGPPDPRKCRNYARKGALSVWDISNGSQRLSTVCKDPITAVSISGQTIVTASENDAQHIYELSVWDLARGNRRDLGEWGHPFLYIALSPQGNVVATGNADNMVCCWHIVP